MDTRQLGRSELKVSTIGLGCNNFGGRIDMDQSRQVIWKALDEGVTFFDTAPSYGDDNGSEIALGAFLGKRRQDVVLATKFGADRKDGEMLITGSSRADIIRDVDASLRRLKTDWIDLYQQHRRDPDTPMEETLQALAELIKAGKIRAAGISGASPEVLEDAVAIAERLQITGFVSDMDEYNLLNREVEAELLPATRKHGLSFLPFFPLASGLLTGKYRKDEKMPEGARLTRNQGLAKHFMTPERMDRTEALIALSGRSGASMVGIAVAWLLSRAPVASVIAGASTPDQLVANIAAGKTRLSDDDLAEIDAITA